MSFARRVRAGIALHAGVNVIFAAAAVFSAAGGATIAEASVEPIQGGVYVSEPGLPVLLPDAPQVHPLLTPTPTTAVASPPATPVALEVVEPVTTTTTTSTARAIRATTTVTTAPAAATGPFREVVSTGYCLSGTTASGRPVTAGIAAMNGVPLGTRWMVHNGPRSGGVFEVTDRIGHGTQFDIWFADCDHATAYGRRTITIEQVG